MVNELVVDVIQCSIEQLRDARPADIEAVRSQPRPLVAMSAAMLAAHRELKQFLGEHLYRHQRVLRMTIKARRVVSELFGAFISDAKLMPEDYYDSARRAEEQEGLAGRARNVADYVAGMTDRYAILEHGRLFDPKERP
jgi:dGTPase